MFVQTETMTMLDCSMGHNVYVQTLDRKETAREINATMVVQATVASRCVEGLDTSISFIPIPTKQLLMTGAVETRHKTNITKNGMLTWIIVVSQVSQDMRGTCL